MVDSHIQNNWRRHLTSIPVSPGPSAAERVATADGVGPANITVVRTAREFQAAFTSGAQDVQIRGHLDLASLALAFHSRGTQPPTVLGDSSPATRSIRGNCTAPPPPLQELGLSGPPLIWQAPQCLIIADHSPTVLGVSTLSMIWLDALYLRVRAPTKRGHRVKLLDAGYETTVYATRLTLQGGGGQTSSKAVNIPGDTRFYMNDSVVDSVGGQHPVINVDYSAAFLNHVTFSNVNQTTELQIQRNADAPAPGPVDYSQIRGRGLQRPSVVHVNGESASVAAVSTTFENVETRIDAVFGSEGGGLVIADDTEGAEVDVYTYEYDYSEVYSYTRDLTFAVAPAPDAEAIADLAASRIPLPRATDPWFVALQAALRDARPGQIRDAPRPPPNPPPPPLPAVPGDAAPEIAAVYTAGQLQRAFHAGVRDIEIRAHLDLRDLPLWDDPISKKFSGSYQFGVVGRSTRSIRGRCDDAPLEALTPGDLGLGSAAAEPWQAPRCVLVVSKDFLISNSPGLWLDALHIQYSPEDTSSDGTGAMAPSDYTYSNTYFDYDYGEIRGGAGPVALRMMGWGKAYVTDSVVQGDGATAAAAVWIENCVGGLFMKDSAISGLLGRRQVWEGEGHPVVRVSYGAALFDSCSFTNLAAPEVDADDYSYVYQYKSRTGAIDAHGANATVALRNCAVADIAAERPATVRDDASIFSSDPDLTVVDIDIIDYDTYVRAYDILDTEPFAAEAPAAPMPPWYRWGEGHPARSPPPPLEGDPWFVAVQQVLKSPPASAYLSDFRHATESDASRPESASAEAPGGSSAPAPGPSGVEGAALGPLEAAVLLPPSDRAALAGFGLAPPESDAGLSHSAAIGIVLAALLLLALLAVALALVFRGPAARRASRKRAAAARKGTAADSETRGAATTADEGSDAASRLEDDTHASHQGSSGPDRQGSSGPADVFVRTQE